MTNKKKLYADIILNLRANWEEMKEARRMARDEGGFSVHFRQIEDAPGFEVKISELEMSHYGWIGIDVFHEEGAIVEDEIISEVAYLLAKETLGELTEEEKNEQI